MISKIQNSVLVIYPFNRLSTSIFNKTQCYFNSSKICFNRNEALVSLLNKLSMHVYDLNLLDFNERRTVNPEHMKKLKINKSWYFEQVKAKCCGQTSGPEAAEMLSKLTFEEQLEILSHEDFNKLVIKDCVLWAVNMIKCDGWVEEPDLLKSSVICLLKDVSSVVNCLPRPHQVMYRRSCY